jgi:hypothetical protein
MPIVGVIGSGVERTLRKADESSLLKLAVAVLEGSVGSLQFFTM